MGLCSLCHRISEASVQGQPSALSRTTNGLRSPHEREREREGRSFSVPHTVLLHVINHFAFCCSCLNCPSISSRGIEAKALRYQRCCIRADSGCADPAPPHSCLARTACFLSLWATTSPRSTWFAVVNRNHYQTGDKITADYVVIKASPMRPSRIYTNNLPWSKAQQDKIRKAGPPPCSLSPH